MHTSQRAPMTRARSRTTPPLGRQSKVDERHQLAADITAELEPEPSTFSPRVDLDYADYFDDLGDLIDDLDHEAHLADFDEYTLELDGEPYRLDDRGLLPGWGTGVSWEDLQGLTITRTPYLWSSGRS